MKRAEYNHITDYIDYVKRITLEHQHFIARQQAKVPVKFQLEALMKEGKQARLEMYQAYYKR